MKKLLSSFGVFVVASAATCTVNCKTTCKTVKKNLNILPESIQIHSETTVESFKDELIDALKTQPGFKNLTITKIKIEKGTTAGTILQDSDITGSTIQVFLSVETAGSTEFEGTKALVVDWSVQTKKSLNNLIVPTTVVQHGANINEFKIALTNAIKFVNPNNDFATITDNDYILRKYDNSADLTYEEVSDAWIWRTMDITIKAKPTSSKFAGKKTIKVNLYADFSHLKRLSTVVLPGANINEFKSALTNTIKTANSSNVFATLTDDDYVLRNDDDNADLTYEDVVSATTKEINVTIKSILPGRSKFAGKKTIEINLYADLWDLTKPTTFDLQVAKIDEFKSALTNAIKTANSTNDFATLTDDDYVLRNAENNADLIYHDILIASYERKISIMIKAKPTSLKFKGNKWIDIRLI